MADFNQPIRVSKGDIFGANLYFSWAQNTVGFGQCSISLGGKGEISADTENMGKEWLRRALYAVVDTLVDNARIE